MRKTIKKLFSFRLSKRLLIVNEIILIVLIILFAMLYSRWDRIFGADEWTVTQYGPRDINSSFYTIYNPQKGLIVVDGGWREDAEYVRSAIRRCGGHVNAWILTHPHLDHVGAFNVIWPDRKGIRIDEVIASPMAEPDECMAVAPWDSVDAYYDFLALNVPDLHYVRAGDSLEICGLTFDIFNSFDKQVQKRSKDYQNDGSIMFKVTGPAKTFLFCADVGKSMSKYLYRKWGNALKADYLQMGHHGNGGLKKGFYTKVAPEKAFFDAPDWLMYDETGTYDTPNKIKLMESLGSEILSFNSAPNAVSLG